MKRHISIVFMGVLLCGGYAHAEKHLKLAEHMQKQIALANEAFATSKGGDFGPLPFDLNRILLGLAPSASFGINNVLNLTVAPEITLVWEKTEDENR
ncbi:MAG TPA: hypothetical protein VIH99_03245 [Bdellovibrionota bacterium]|jgi:hypothetical protein